MHHDTATSPTGASSRSTRNAGLDVARGLAVLGTFATNVWVFTHPDGLLGSVLDPLDEGLGVALAQVLPLGGSLALLSLLFGIGLELQHRSALRRGVPWGRAHRVRALVLLAESTVHFLLVAEFDVLMGYAVALLVAGPVLARPDRSRRRLVVVLLSAHAAALTALVLVLGRTTTGTGAGPGLDTPYADGSFLDLVVFRLENLLVFRAEPVALLPLSVASFLLGAGLVRAGLLAPGPSRLRRRLVAVGVLGLVAEGVLLAVGGGSAVLATRYGTAVLVALGALSLLLQAQDRRGADGPRWLGRRLAEVGRCALSGYVLQNLLASALCHGWGLGWAATAPDRPLLTLLVFVLVAAVVLAGAHVLARTGRRGPLEALSARWQHRLLRSGREHRKARVG